MKLQDAIEMLQAVDRLQAAIREYKLVYDNVRVTSHEDDQRRQDIARWGQILHAITTQGGSDILNAYASELFQKTEELAKENA